MIDKEVLSLYKGSAPNLKIDSNNSCAKCDKFEGDSEVDW